MKKLSKSYLKEILLSDNSEYQKKFTSEFAKEIDQLSNDLFLAYQRYEKIEARDKNREFLIKSFIFNAIQNIVSAFNIFISGYLVSPGNLMRQYHESIAWSILCSTAALNYYEKITEEIGNKTKSIKFHKGLDIVQKNLSKLTNIDASAWRKFKKIRDSYHNLSHTTLLAISANAIIDGKGCILGGYFDKGKIKQYRQEIKKMLSAAKLLPNIIDGIENQLNTEKL